MSNYQSSQQNLDDILLFNYDINVSLKNRKGSPTRLKRGKAN